MEWQWTDPRLSIKKHGQIVIVRPDRQEPGWGWVEAKESWSIGTTWDDHLAISMDEDWDEDWCWISAPPKKWAHPPEKKRGA